MQRDLYPDDWEAIAYMVKEEANWVCEECHRPCRRPDEDLLDFCQRLNSLTWTDLVEHPQKWTLTVAHLDHTPGNCKRSNLKALCAPCHCRYDLKAMGTKRRLKRERQGQLRIDGV
jgi:hypothetical protein